MQDAISRDTDIENTIYGKNDYELMFSDWLLIVGTIVRKTELNN